MSNKGLWSLVIVLLLLGGLVVHPVFAQDTQYEVKVLRLSPSDDTYVKNGKYSENNYGTAYKLYVGNYKGNVERIYIKFDLGELKSILPQGAEIVSATLHMYTYHGTNEETIRVDAYEVLDDSWSENSLTWENQPAHGSLLDSVAVGPQGEEWSVWNVTSFVRSKLSGDGKVSIALIAENETEISDSAGYTSKESKFTNDHPYLEIVYRVPVEKKEPLPKPKLGTRGLGLSLYYSREYAVYKSTFEDLVTTVSTLLGELKAANATIPESLMEEIESVNHTIAEIQKEYSLYENFSIEAHSKTPLLYVPAMIHIRRATVLLKSTLPELRTLAAELKDLYKKVSESPSTPVSNETGQTSTNQTTENVTAPSNVTSNQTTVSNATATHVTRVLIDLSHGQHYFTKYGFKGLVEDIKKLGWNVSVTHSPLTYDELKKYDVVILANPGTKLSNEEISALRKYVEEGGALFVAGDWYKYLNPTLNELLEGTGVQFEKTELMDDEKNSGRPYYPFVGIYNRDCPVTKFIPEDWRMYYNGDTLNVTGDAVWIIRGYKSSYTVDATKNTVHERGSEPVVAAAVTFGKGKIVVYGSSKALSDAYYGKYIKSNWPFIKGALLWLVGEES
ncbi:DUF4350 domain-containing protein [Thermococcus henrietii]|uniref:DUF4350 domain-containing protein n=1 Tax=Thermococcus henrietii TaxID=2016361 RepID=UPI000C083CED|nr:DUF4350 domain-containing protein [Thermococcus henrietii]